MSISEIKKQKAYDKTQGVCIICGRQVGVSEKWSVEHYIPRAIYKWIDNQELKNKLESIDNLFIVHAYCNFQKDSSLPTSKLIDELPINEALRANIHQLYKSVERHVLEYKAMKQSVWDYQQHKCVFCHKEITLRNSILRRKNNKLTRCRENAMCLCFKCSVRAGNQHYKHRMVKKKQL
ncbi:HNH endonuclease [Kingella negevensis]|uniref:HNH domain-containing protein n=1 Tax=Kingella negevensis TaxID=1522312 RepID=A0A238TFD7_9NEIS|nr:HNH endonuclease [Kingella negevensis]MDK4679764.1 HNH endonuclease [Kingella negevensis]MDK4682518.1 HNH endonuclease [Kingella negevensis]MDK4684468.1 HNH endonuclease [Kingella negevensis]MDK4690714.1 HNH endonuclease [Kingella negevensis]MDK4694138.1 HNH endonuclease [Kingella negevensis]